MYKLTDKMRELADRFENSIATQEDLQLLHDTQTLIRDLDKLLPENLRNIN